jgi:hypothetical protein
MQLCARSSCSEQRAGQAEMNHSNDDWRKDTFPCLLFDFGRNELFSLRNSAHAVLKHGQTRLEKVV